jgi:outer membrane protein OmpA-like peptidoglycan-associated protein/tetratricopeptide (TPR) repeat protein
MCNNMKKLFTGIICLLLVINQIAAQKNSKEIKGDKYYSFYSFDKAIEKYTQSDDLTIEGQRKLANSYFNSENTTKSEEVYAKYINQTGITSEDIYNYASVLRTNGKYEESNKWMDKFKEMNPNDLRAKNYAASNDKLTNLLKDEGRYKIDHLNINSNQQDFGTSFYNDKIVFASSRSGLGTVKRDYNWDNKPFLNLYVADVASGQLKNPTNLNKKINKKLHEGPASFANSGSLMAFTKNNYEGKSKDGIVKLQIFFSELKDGKWNKEEPFKLNNSEYSVGHPFLLPDGKSMFFSSDMPGGFGGVDLYLITKGDSGAWGKPENLGNKINTEGDEMFPFYEANSEILFFASNGHLGLGGLDIFLSTLSGKVMNAGAPLNTQSDDFALIVDDKMRKGYFSSNRKGGNGDDDIYAFELLKPFAFGKTIKGVAKDKSGTILSGTIVKLLDEGGKEVGTITTLEDGGYSFPIENDGNYSLKGNKETYFEGANKASTLGKEDVVIADVILEKDPGLSLYCIVTDKLSKVPLEGVKVKLVNTSNGNEEMYTTPIAGDFRKSLLENKLNDKINYSLVFEKEGYLAKTVTYNKLLDKVGQYNIHQDLDISLDKIEIGTDLAKIIDINPIYFDLGKYNIRKDASVELEKIIKVMNENPNMIIELGSHTDCRSSIAFNEKLSDNRAKASAKYIKAKITNPERISGKGYGESKLVNDCACEGSIKSNCSEEDHQKNRRTEFIIVKL